MRARAREHRDIAEVGRKVALVAAADKPRAASDGDEELCGGRKEADDAHRAQGSAPHRPHGSHRANPRAFARPHRTHDLHGRTSRCGESGQRAWISPPEFDGVW
jgi:hypothetical protein